MSSGNPLITRIFKLLLAILLIVVFYYVAVPVSRSILFFPRNTLFPKIVIGLKIKELDENEISIIEGLSTGRLDQFAREEVHIDVPQWQRDYYSKFRIPPVVISLDYVYVPQRLQLPPNALCLTQVSIKHFVPNREEPTESKLLKTTTPVCLDLGVNYFISYESEQKSIIYDRHLDPFWYPFDYRALDLELVIDATVKGRELDELDHVVDVVTIPPRWVSWRLLSGAEQKSKIQDSNLSVLLTRPLLYPLLSILVPFTVFMLLVRILPNVAREQGSFWEITVGLTLGLWSFSEVLIPSYIDFPTLIGYVILSLYIPLVLFIRSISRSYARRAQGQPRFKKEKMRKKNPNL